MKNVVAIAGIALLLGACTDLRNPVGTAALPQSTAPVMNVGVEAGASVLLIHGFDPLNSGHDCESIWSQQRDALRALGHTGRIFTVGYYNANRNCERNVSSTVYTKNYAGDWTLVQGTANGRNGILDHNTPIEHAAYRVAWAIAKENTDNGAASVRAVVHSMGGLVVRYAVQQASMGNSNFPTLAQMNLTRVWTLGTPHLGTGYANWGTPVQGQQMKPSSGFLSVLNGDQRVGNATWYAFTSLYTFTGDGVVDSNSACWARATWCGRHYGSISGNGYASRGAYGHGDYMKDPNLYYALANYDSRSPLNGTNWGARFYDVGATGMVARNLSRN
ncbi:MAG TPA: hypothetical protein VE913_16920 [Longimicrobium sp.]|nr:hypothetical protein [Longimicrobium sp.]